MKKCGKCKTTKTLNSFGKCKSTVDGLNGTCLDCCSEIARSKSKHRPDVTEISKKGEVWEKINKVIGWVDDTFLVSNLGRVFRQPYLDPQGSRWGGEFCQIVPRFGVPVVTVRNSDPNNTKTKKISISLVYYKLFVNSNFEIMDNYIPIYHYKDDDTNNFINGNCIVTYSIENQPTILLDIYRFISEYFCKLSKSNFRFIGGRELSSISKDDFKLLEKEYNNRFQNLFYKFPQSGGGLLVCIGRSMKKQVGKTSGIIDFLNFNKIDIDKEYSNNRYLSNLGSICDSNAECFVRNVYEFLGLVDGNFQKKNLSEFLNVEKLDYDPLPDEFFIYEGKLYFSETFGFCDNESFDKISDVYNTNKINKKNLYAQHKINFISLDVHGKTYQEILSEINHKLLSFNIIEKEIIFSYEFWPKSYRLNMKEELINILEEMGDWYTPLELKTKNYKLFRMLSRFCDNNNFTLTEYLANEIFKTSEITFARGVPSVITHKTHREITKEVKDLVKKLNIKNTYQLQSINPALYWRLYRMCKSKKINVSDFFFTELDIDRRRKVYSEEELSYMFRDCKNRWDCQKKNDNQYRKAKELGLIDVLFPKN